MVTEVLARRNRPRRYVAFHLTLGARVRWAHSCLERLLIFTSDGVLLVLEEKPWGAKLELLYKKHLYGTAINLATSQGLGRAVVSGIHREFAQHLYSKGDFAAAAEQFVHTIGELPPSSVISAFLSAQRVPELTQYLQALHYDAPAEAGAAVGNAGAAVMPTGKGSFAAEAADARTAASAATAAAYASPEHTTLLLHCLCKLSQADGVRDYVQWACASPYSPAVHAVAAIRVLRASGYAPLAVQLSEACGEHRLLLGLLLEETQAYDKALDMVRAMPPAEARAALLASSQSRILLDHRPNETAKLLADLCASLPAPASGAPPAGAAVPSSSLGGSGGGGSGGGDADGMDSDGMRGDHAPPVTAGDAGGETLEDFIPLFASHQHALVTFLAALAERPEQQPVAVIDTLLTLYLAPEAPQDEPPPMMGSFGSVASNGATASEPAAVAAAPAVADAANADADADMSVSSRRAAALALLKRGGAQFTVGHAVLLCLQYEWDEGLVLLYERLNWHSELLAHHISKGDDEAVMRTCRRYSEIGPQMWLQALGHFVSAAPPSLTAVARGAAAAGFQLPAAPAWSASEAAKEAAAEKQWRAHIGEVIGVIEADELLSPVELLQRLSEGGRVPVGVAADFLERHMRATEAAAAEQLRESTRAAEEHAKMRAEIDEIDHGARVFQLSKCSACHGALEVPTVHFLCLHSYHQSCLGDHDQECLVCQPQRKRVAEHQQQQRALARGHDAFYAELEQSADGFATIAEFMGRGMLCSLDAPP